MSAPRVFFTSDTHHGHARIIELCKRPFRDVQEMDETMIRNWNAIVGERDTVYHLGDFSLGGVPSSIFRKRLNGRIHLLIGNHDKRALKEPELWESISPMLDIKVDGQRITLCHYAMRTWLKSHKGAWSLYGHSHHNLPDDPNALSIDVGVDGWGFAPVSMAQIRERMAQKQFVPVDHHGAADDTDGS